MNERVAGILRLSVSPEGGGGAGAAEPPTRKEREQERHRQELMAAALKLLEERSYQEISVNEIAAAAEFSVGYVYKLFPGKEALYTSIIKTKQSEHLDIASRILDEEGSYPELLRRFADGILGWLDANPAFAGPNYREINRLPEFRETLSFEQEFKRRQGYPLMQRLMDQGKREGLVDPTMELETFLHGIRALFFGFIEEATDFPDPGGRLWAGGMRGLAPHIVRFILRGFAPEVSDEPS